MPRGRFQQQQWDAREEAILDALEALSAERGFASVTMDDLADRVGISKATLYQHFSGKDAMLARLMALHEDRFLGWLERDRDLPPVERLRRAMRYLMDGHITPLQGVVNVSRETILPVFENNPDLVERHERIIALLTDIIADGQARGTIAADLTPHAVIGAMIALSNISMGRIEPTECTQQAGTRPGYAEQMILMFERSLRPAGASGA